MALVLGERYFDRNTARLWSGRAVRHLDSVAALMHEHPALSLDVEGHTDNTGAVDANHDLSIDRAIAVKSALVLRGVEPSRINATGYGETQPIDSNDSETGRLRNRRVELVFPDATVAGL